MTDENEKIARKISKNPIFRRLKEKEGQVFGGLKKMQ